MSTIIIRLQNLPLSAKAHDIREFFGDLKIPKGSVNIVGGSNGDAFIGFQTDEDARLAMLLDGRLLHQAKIRLMLSSRREMEQVIADAQALAGAAKQQNPPSGNAHQLVHQQATEMKNIAEDRSAKLPDQLAKDGGQWKAQTEVPTVPSSHSTPFATQQTTAPSFQQLFGGDSWKNPQLQNASSQLLVESGQGPQLSFQEQPGSQPVPVFPGSAQPPFGGVPPSSLGVLLGSPNKTSNIPQQPPGFPPPLNIPSQALQSAGAPLQPRPPIPSYAGDGFFNQQPPTGYHGQRFPSQAPQAYAQQQNFRPGQSGKVNAVQHHQFGIQNQAGGGRPPRPSLGRRGGPGGPVQQQFDVGGGPGFGFSGSYAESQFGGGGLHPQQQHFHPRQQQYQQRFDGGATNGGKRRRSRSPPGAVGPGKRFYHGASRENDNNPSAQFPPSAVFPSEPSVKERVCVQLSNVPYKATFFDVKQYLSATDAECVKVTRVYQPDRNYSDRWIVEFDNEKDARSVIRHHGEVNNRTIRTERIPARKADEQYAMMEPDEKDGGGKRSSDEPNSKRERDRGGRGERDRPRERDRGSNRSRSPKGRSGRGRSMDTARSNPSERGSASTAVWAKEERAKQPTAENSLDGKADRDRQTKEQQRQHKPQHQQQPPSMGSSNPTGSLNMISNAAVFGAFSFPDNHNNTAYRARPGGTAHIGAKANEPKPLRAFEFFPPLPTSGTHRPPIPLNHLEGGGVAGGQKASSPPANQHNPHIPPLIRTAASNGGFWPRAAAAASAGAFGTARQQLSASTSANPVQPILPANLSRPTTAAKTSAALFNASVGSLDTSIGSTAAGLVIQEDYSMDEADSDNDARVHSAPSKTDGITDQPPLDLLEPESDTLAIPSQAQLDTKAERRAFDSAPNREFTPQELELRPHLAFLERYREDPNSSSCIRLENVPRMVYAEQLAEFLGVQFDFPCENIARMQNGVLYINLPNEAMATKAASQNMNILNGHQIIITQLKKTEMADSIRQNMIIIREMYRVSVVARGFPLITQRNEVISMFERFSLNRDGVEKCAVKPNDTVSTFFLTFSSAQDCREAIRALNDTQTVGGARIKVFQPADVASLNRTS